MAKYRFIDGELKLVEGEEPSDKPFGMPAIEFFREGWYEHIAADPIYISSMRQLKEECERHGVTSHYERDSGPGDRGRQRWI